MPKGPRREGGRKTFPEGERALAGGTGAGRGVKQREGVAGGGGWGGVLNQKQGSNTFTKGGSTFSRATESGPAFPQPSRVQGEVPALSPRRHETTNVCTTEEMINPVCFTFMSSLSSCTRTDAPPIPSRPKGPSSHSPRGKHGLCPKQRALTTSDWVGCGAGPEHEASLAGPRAERPDPRRAVGLTVHLVHLRPGATNPR